VKTTWTDDEIRALGVRTDVETAGSIFGLSRTQSYGRVRDGSFPVPIIRVGRRMVVPTAPIRKLLQIDAAEPVATGPATTSTTPAIGRSPRDQDTPAA
jgi:hypothetical protein